MLTRLPLDSLMSAPELSNDDGALLTLSSHQQHRPIQIMKIIRLAVDAFIRRARTIYAPVQQPRADAAQSKTALCGPLRTSVGLKFRGLSTVETRREDEAMFSDSRVHIDGAVANSEISKGTPVARSSHCREIHAIQLDYLEACCIA